MMRRGRKESTSESGDSSFRVGSGWRETSGIKMFEGIAEIYNRRNARVGSRILSWTRNKFKH